MAAAATPRNKVFMRPEHGGHINVSIAQLLEWIETNSYKHHTLVPIRTEVPDEGPDAVGAPLDRLELPSYSAIPLQPSGMLSAIAYVRDPMFSEATPNMRAGMLRELATKLQMETDTLAGGRWARKRKRIYDGIGALANGAPMKDEDAYELFCGLAALCEIQFVFVRFADSVDERGVGAGAGAGVATASCNSITFSSNPDTWSPDKPTWIVDVHGRWIALPSEEEGPVIRRLSAWISDLEDTKRWSIAWPEAEGTKTELVAALQESPTWQSAHSKLLKEELARRLGRWRAVQRLYTLSR
jgi:hypothetical protein